MIFSVVVVFGLSVIGLGLWIEELKSKNSKLMDKVAGLTSRVSFLTNSEEAARRAMSEENLRITDHARFLKDSLYAPASPSKPKRATKPRAQRVPKKK